MNPSGMTGEPNSLNRPSVFSENYPPDTKTTFDWSAVPGTSQVPYDLGAHQNPGFNMQPQLGTNLPNFQFSNNHQPFGHTVQFPISNAYLRDISRPMWTFGCKRKTDSPPPTAAKQHITEEKMSEHLSKLHISSETPISDMESEQVKEQRLYMCEEMKKFQAQTESILPESLLTSISSPCTALVLWKPPASLLVPSFFNQDAGEETENNNNNSARDNNPVVPMNDMDMDDL